MPPKTNVTRRIKATRTVKKELPPIQYEMVQSNPLFQMALNMNNVDDAFSEVFSDFYEKLDGLAEKHSTENIKGEYLKQVLHDCFKVTPECAFLIPKKEIKTETLESDSVRTTESVIALPSSPHPIPMEVDSAPDSAPKSTGTNTTASIFHEKSYTCTSSSSEGLNTTAIDQDPKGFERIPISIDNTTANEVIHEKSYTLTSSSDEGIQHETGINKLSKVFKKVPINASANRVVHEKSFTCTSDSNEDSSDKSVSETSKLLDELSMTEELDLKKPLHSSTPLKDEVQKTDDLKKEAKKVSRVPTFVAAYPKVTPQKVSSITMPKEVKASEAKIPKVSEAKPIPSTASRTRHTSITSNAAPRTPNVSSNSGYRRRLITPKSENHSKASVSVKNTASKQPLPTPNKEVPMTDKSKHADILRQKFLKQKTEKARLESEKRAAVMERKRAQEKMKSESYKSPSRIGRTISRSNLKETPSQRPAKKTRIHTSEQKEKKVPVVAKPVFPVTPSKPVVVHEPLKEVKNSYVMTPDKVFIPNSLNDYGIDDLSCDDETDDEDKPRKRIPEWADFKKVKEKVRQQIVDPPIDIEQFFGPIEQPNLFEMFENCRNNRKRGSSAQWKP